MLGYLKTDAFERYHHTYPASYLWVFMDGKFVRELSDVVGGEELRFKSCVITVRQSSSNLQIRKLKCHGCINKYVGHDRAFIFRDRPQIFQL